MHDHQPPPARAQRHRHRRRDHLLPGPVRCRAGQAATGLRQLRDPRPAAEAGPVPQPRRRVTAQPPRRRGRHPGAGRRRGGPVRRRRAHAHDDRGRPLLPRRAGQGVGRRPRRAPRRVGVLHRPRRRPRHRARPARPVRVARRRRPTPGRAAVPASRRRDMAADAVVVEDVAVAFGRDAGVGRRRPARRAGHDARGAGPQRRRQDHADPGPDHPDPPRSWAVC